MTPTQVHTLIVPLLKEYAVEGTVLTNEVILRKDGLPPERVLCPRGFRNYPADKLLRRIKLRIDWLLSDLEHKSITITQDPRRTA